MQDTVKAFTDIPAINRFLGYCRVRAVPSKTVLIHAGDTPDVLYYIIRGSVEVMIEDEEGNEMVLAYLNKGQFFGEMGLFADNQQRSAWVRTRTQCELAEMTYPRFRQIASESPGLVFELANITQDTLCFWGVNDNFCPVSGATKVAERVPSSRTVIISQCGHWVMVEYPKLFNETTLRFLNGDLG